MLYTAFMNEIEKKYLINEIDTGKLISPSFIKQGYIAVDEDGTEVRIRQKGEKFYLTVKSGGSLVRMEEEMEIDEEKFNNLWKFAENRSIIKNRYEISLGNELTGELDIYEGRLEGLKVIEVEFPNMETAESFKAPEWFGQDITEDKSYKNKNLAKQ